MSNDDNRKDIFDGIDTLINLYEDNKGHFEDMFDDGNSIKMDGQSPLKQTHVQDDEVLISVELSDGSLTEVEIMLEDSTIKLAVGDDVITADAPEDVIMEEADATMKNGILTVTIPREGGEE